MYSFGPCEHIYEVKSSKLTKLKSSCYLPSKAQLDLSNKIHDAGMEEDIMDITWTKP